MNRTPRLLNRLVLAVVGLLVFAAGATGVALASLPDAASWWRATSPEVGAGLQRLREGTTLDGQGDTWLWIALAAALLLVMVLLVLWIAAQGRGRTGIFAPAGGPQGHDGALEGSVTITAAAAEQALKAALLDRSDLAGASVSTWEVRRVAGLRVRVFPRKGVPPYEIADEVSRLVEALDAVTGYRTPVLISISSGARVHFTRADRVD